MKAAQGAGRSAGSGFCQPSHGGPLSARPGAGAGLVPRDGTPRPRDAPPLGATTSLPAAWLSQPATCHATPLHSRLLAALPSVRTCWAHVLPRTPRPPSLQGSGTSRCHHQEPGEAQALTFSPSEPTLEREQEPQRRASWDTRGHSRAQDEKVLARRTLSVLECPEAPAGRGEGKKC